MVRQRKEIAILIALAAVGCRETPTPEPSPAASATSSVIAAEPRDSHAGPEATAPAGDPQEAPVLLNPSPALADEPHLNAPLAALLEARAAIGRRDRAALAPYFLTPSAPGGSTRDPVKTLPFEHLARLLSGAPDGPPRVAGRRAVIQMRPVGRGNPPRVIIMLDRDGYRIDLAASAAWRPVDPGPKDALNRPVSLADATEGIEGEGQLVAVLTTTRGAIRCVLHADRAPRTVANFVALARGLRGFKDPQTGAWARRPFYDRLPFHRIVAGQLIQSGDPYGDGRGGPGYTIADELDPTLRHDAAGVLSMANRGANTGGSQFFITLHAFPALDDRNAVFGRCAPAELLRTIAGGQAIDGKAVDPTRITSVQFERL